MISRSWGITDRLTVLGELDANRHDRLVNNWRTLQRWTSGESLPDAEAFCEELLTLYHGTSAMHSELLISEYKTRQERLSSQFLATVDHLRAIGTVESLSAVRDLRQQTIEAQQALDRHYLPRILEYLCKGRMFAEVLRCQNDDEDETETIHETHECQARPQ